MSPDLDGLIKLQHLDTQIDEARRAIAAHPQRLADADARLSEARQAVEQAKQRLKDNQEARRALEKDVATFQGRISKFRDQQGAVKTNKEYQALGHEMETAAKDLAGVEEKVLERMMEADTIAADVTQVEAAMAAEQKLIDAEKKELVQELTSVEAALAKATEARSGLVGNINPRVMALFQQVGKARKGLAIVSTTRDGLCSACHVRLRPQVFQLVRANDTIIQCDSCQRILYYVPPPPPIDHAVVHK
jgi:predicted  nucleic acid-binding Zn-ribbon protein